MAHFAQLDENNLVTQVIVVHNNELLDADGNESEEKGIEFCQSLFGSTTRWVQTSYNGKIRKHYAAIGFTFDEARDAFVPPKPFASWVLNEELVLWEAPIPYPDDEQWHYKWEEATLSWVKTVVKDR